MPKTLNSLMKHLRSSGIAISGSTQKRALKNYTIEAVVSDAGSSSFEDVWRRSLTDYRSYSGSAYRKAWERRQRLRGEIDGMQAVHQRI